MPSFHLFITVGEREKRRLQTLSAGKGGEDGRPHEGRSDKSSIPPGARGDHGRSVLSLSQRRKEGG